LLIRADASQTIGTGHVMRCLALAQVWQKGGGAVVFLAAQIPESLCQRLVIEGIEITNLKVIPGSAEDSTATIALAQRHQVEAVVVDGYQFDAGYQQRLKQAGLRLLWLDDYGHARRYVADLVLNQNLGSSAALYADRTPGTQLLLGARYVLLRQPFLKWQTWERKIEPTAKKILVTLGGSDSENVTLRILQALPRMSGIDVTVLAGASNPNLQSLQVHCAQAGPCLIVDAANVPELMAEADLAIAAGGTTVWELAFMGLPALLVTLADNQAASVEHIRAAGAARSFGRAEQLKAEEISRAVGDFIGDPAARREMSERGRKLIDGEGAFRVWLYLKESSLQIHRATSEDSRLVWEWANGPEVRAVSFSSNPIPWENHVRWFQKRLADPQCCLWIARDRAGQPVGQARLEITDRSAVIAMSLDRERRGRNLGALLIWLACRKLFRETPVDTVHALIKPDNAASVRAFLKAGFEKTGEKTVKGQPALAFTLTKSRVEA
jgi:UDP-2,4-diacetamido-2,4,6-trideoxy-beta-L-altropyranose hydrolase